MHEQPLDEHGERVGGDAADRHGRGRHLADIAHGVGLAHDEDDIRERNARPDGQRDRDQRDDDVLAQDEPAG